MRRLAQMEITSLEGGNAFSGGCNLHPKCLKPTRYNELILDMLMSGGRKHG